MSSGCRDFAPGETAGGTFAFTAVSAGAGKVVFQDIWQGGQPRILCMCHNAVCLGNEYGMLFSAYGAGVLRSHHCAGVSQKYRTVGKIKETGGISSIYNSFILGSAGGMEEILCTMIVYLCEHSCIFTEKVLY